jgi:hypothetical protein
MITPHLTTRREHLPRTLRMIFYANSDRDVGILMVAFKFNARRFSG